MRIKKSGIVLAGIVGSLLFGTSVYAQSYASVNVETLNVRQAPRIESSIVTMYSKDETVKIVDQVSPGWYKIEDTEGTTNYISSEYVDVFKVKGVIKGEGVNSRVYPTTDAQINRQLSDGRDISVFYKVGDWYYISLGDEALFGFVHESYIDSEFLYLLPKKDISEVKAVEFKEVKKAEPKKAAPQKAKSVPAPAKVSKGVEIAEYAKQFVGNPYVYGGNSLTKGVDCSGFTQQVMKKAGVSLQRSSSAQYAKNGVKVSTNELQPGDLLFYGYNGKVSHVGIYIGDKKMVNASSAKTGVLISNAFRTSGKPLIGAKRVL